MNDPWRLLEIVVLALFGILWWVYRARDAETQAKLHKLTGEFGMLRSIVDRAEERDKGYDKSLDRLEKALEKFDREIGEKIDRLSSVLTSAYRRFSPPTGIKAVKDPRRDEE